VSALGLLNFLVLQWFGVRLARVIERRPIPGDLAGAMMKTAGWITDDDYRCRAVPVGWQWLRWIWPLTGWWSPYRWIARRS
jgi:hypothetical protein